MMTTGRVEESLALCRQMIRFPQNEEEAVFAQQFGQRYAKRHEIKWPETPQTTPEEHHLSLPLHGSVELATSEYLSSQGLCYYVENTLFTGVLGLTIWPAIFSPVQGAFSHPFQHQPHDFYDPEFYSRRRAEIDAALAIPLKEPERFIELVLNTFEQKKGLSNPLVFWQSINKPLIELALRQIPVPHWQKIFERLLLDLRNHRNGMPDLILFPHTGGYQLIEVKGPGDRLQNNQKRWMQFFQQNNMPHWVARISWQDDTHHD